MLLILYITIRIVCADDDLDNPLKLPFTFTINNLSEYQYLRVDPDGCCNTNFSLSFSQKEDYNIGGDVLLNIMFVRLDNVSFIIASGRKNNDIRVYDQSEDLNNTKWLRGQCLLPFEVHFTNRDGKQLKIVSLENPTMKYKRAFSFEINDTLYDTKFITVDGEIKINNAHNIGIYTYHDKMSIQGPAQNLRLVEFPDDFPLRERCSLVLTVRPLWETRKNVVYIRIRDRDNQVDLALVTLQYKEVYKFEMGCSTIDKWGKERKMRNNYYFEDDSKRLYFPMRPEFFAMIYFNFRKGASTELYINNVWYCTFEPLDTNQIPGRLVIEGENNHIALVTADFY